MKTTSKFPEYHNVATAKSSAPAAAPAPSAPSRPAYTPPSRPLQTQPNPTPPSLLQVLAQLPPEDRRAYFWDELCPSDHACFRLVSRRSCALANNLKRELTIHLDDQALPKPSTSDQHTDPCTINCNGIWGDKFTRARHLLCCFPRLERLEIVGNPDLRDLYSTWEDVLQLFKGRVPSSVTKMVIRNILDIKG